ncbi:NPCBM/NEW2 domain-containing protein [Lusitaniella coriacea LEGE 07157]|uniref:NPCBM/NEW2 domain-containing protein n=1 Tax=Lusitaniella coriacea LEGE 07157 TaxID=945747 RepID=A0A8J7DZB6_9CYAN|nr:NPCBM/NEW2 domain-containing protein [Lusitaniella coriacea]MBE9118387.1 NPCBM/NEW2 domain-containing protein [Lusitaniella coriacea LEGE 07157]
MNNPARSTSQNPPPSNSFFSRFTRWHIFYLGTAVGAVLTACVLSAGGYAYLRFTQDAISVKNGQVSIAENNPTNTTHTEDNPAPKGKKIATADGNGVAVGSGDDSDISRDHTNSLNGNNNDFVGGDRTTSSSGHNSPSITGETITVFYNNNRELPGFDKNSGFTAPPSDLSKYSKASDLQPDSFMKQSSAKNLEFETEEIVIGGKIYQSFFQVDRYADNSRFVFKLDGQQKAALLQFGLPDLTSGDTSTGVYLVKIYADGKLLWAGECQRSQSRQIISVPIDIPGATALRIEVTSNGSNPTSLYFTEAQLLRGS